MLLWARCQDRGLGDLLGHVTRHALSACYPVVKERRLLLGPAAGEPAEQASGGQSGWSAHADGLGWPGPDLRIQVRQRVVPLRNGCGPWLAASRARSRGAAILPDSSGLSSGLFGLLCSTRCTARSCDGSCAGWAGRARSAPDTLSVGRAKRMAGSASRVKRASADFQVRPFRPRLALAALLPTPR